MTLKEIRNNIEQAKGRCQEVERTIYELDRDTTGLKKEIKHSEKAQVIIQKVAQDTQAQLEYHISDIVTLALDTIFDDPYKFRVEFVLKRNKTECLLLFERDGELISPLMASGGGVIDVASFALRIALWTLQTPRSRNTIVLDEPFRFLSKDLIPRASVLLKELSQKLNLQMIIVTHIEELAEEANKNIQCFN